MLTQLYSSFGFRSKDPTALVAERAFHAVAVVVGGARQAAGRLEQRCQRWRFRLAFARVQRELGPMTGAVRSEQAALSYQLDALQAELDALRGGVAS